MNERYTRGWIRMQVLSGLVDICKFTPGIANSDTELDREAVLLLIEHLSGQIGKPIQWKRPSPRHGIKVSTIVGYLEAVLNNNNGVPPKVLPPEVLPPENETGSESSP